MTPFLQPMIPWLVHLYTASSAVFGFLALTRIFHDRYRDAFFWIALAVVVDASDGLIARRAQVAARLPHFDGAKLDDIVDYITYVFVPAFFLWHALLVPDRWSIPAATAMLLSSAYGFSRRDAKTEDHFFTGFPSYWNIVVFYMYVAGLPPTVNLVIVLALAALVFVPVRYVYPSRTPVWQTLTIVLGVAWGVLMFVLWWQMPDVSRPVLWASFVFPLYYALLSLALHRRTPA
jgi:phosphatidylcholine synthase